MANFCAQVLPKLSTRLAACMVGCVVNGVELPVLAQITPDSSLGTEQSNLLPTNVIDGGARRGANLFHSFLEFNVSSGQRIDFANPVGVDRIFTRVIGGTRSIVLGTIGVLGNADLFLINPNGILFGPSARLDVRGSFVATTANAIQFGNQGVFSASTPAPVALLTVNPSALLFNQLQAAAIVNQSVAPAGGSPGGFDVFGLRVLNGRNLLLVGGSVQFDRGKVVALGGRVELGGVAASGVVQLDPNYRLSFPIGVERADVSFTNGATIDVAAGGGGEVVVTARNIDLWRQSAIYAGIVAPGGAVTRQAGEVALDATGSITVNGAGTSIANSVSANAVGNGGNIQIRARSFALTEGASILAYSGSEGRAGNINVTTTDAIAISGFGAGFSSAIASQVRPGRSGTGGNVTLRTANLSVTNGAQVGNASFGRGDVGNVTIIADTVLVDGVGDTRSSGITSSVAPRAIGNGGVIDIQTGSLLVTNGGRLFTSTFGQGNAGEIRVNAHDRVGLDGAGSNGFPSAIVSQVASLGVGNGGNIQITAPIVSLTNGAQVAASTFGQGNAADITVRSKNAIALDGSSRNNISSGVFSSVEASAIGNGGNISIISDSLSLTNSAGLFASTSGRGDAGKIEVQARNVQLVTGGRILSTVEPTGIGNGREIEINTRSLSLSSNAQINAGTASNGAAGRIQIITNSLDADTGGQLRTATTSRGAAGNILVDARDRVTLTGRNTGFFANTAPNSSGNGSDITVNTNQLQLFNNARIAVGSQGQGRGGDITIQADRLTLDNQAVLSAETASTQGGNIRIQNPGILLLRRNSLISTSAGTAQAGGNGGNITINSSFIASVLSENNDIRANAFTGNGGNINITAQGIYGIQFQPFDTLNSDITASSQFGLNGIVTLNTPNVDPTRGTVTLATTFSTPPLAQGCAVPNSQTSRFVSTGRGGISTNPVAPLTADTIWQDLDSGLEQASGGAETHSPTASDSAPIAIVEAQGWEIMSDGTIVLTAQAPRVLTPNCIQFNLIRN